MQYYRRSSLVFDNSGKLAIPHSIGTVFALFVLLPHHAVPETAAASVIDHLLSTLLQFSLDLEQDVVGLVLLRQHFAILLQHFIVLYVPVEQLPAQQHQDKQDDS